MDPHPGLIAILIWLFIAAVVMSIRGEERVTPREGKPERWGQVDLRKWNRSSTDTQASSEDTRRMT